LIRSQAKAQSYNHLRFALCVPMAVFIRVNSMAVSAQHFALVDFFHQLMPSSFGVLTYGEQFFAMNVIEIKRRRMRVVATFSAPTVCLDFVDQVFT
jgi:hypothetical protein